MKAVLALCLAMACPPVGAEILTGRVVGITDGDTLTLLDAANLRQRQPHGNWVADCGAIQHRSLLGIGGTGSKKTPALGRR